MNEREKDYGIVYVLTNPAMPGLVKIGMTKRQDLDVRMSELYGTGVPVPFECEYACKVDSNDCEKIEKALHKAFFPQRVNQKREFFRIEPNQAVSILELFNKGDMTKEVSVEIDNDLDTDDRNATEVLKTARRPPLNYYDMGIKQGELLTYTGDTNVTVAVTDAKKVTYNGVEQSLTAVTKSLLGIESAIQPTPYWTYKDKNLRDIYDETYPLE